MTAVLKVKNNRFYAVINYKEDGSYKQKWISLGLSVKNNKRKAEAILDEIKQKYAEGYCSSGNVLFVVYLKNWVEKKKDFIEQSTWEGYKIYAEKHIIPYFEPLRLHINEIKPKHIQDYYQYKYVNGRLDGKPGGLSIPSIKKHSIVLKESLDDAVLDELITRNPAAGVKLPNKNVSMKEKTFLTVNKANEVLQAFSGHRLKGLVCVALYYGLRRSEVLGLRWSAIDFAKETITINHTVVKNCTIIRKDTVKTQSSFHTYKMIGDVRMILLGEKRRQLANKVVLREKYNDSGYVFTWDDGTLYRPDYITKAFQSVLKKAGLPMMRFHDLRHSTASILYDKGWNIKDIQMWLRHSSIDVTSDIYTHITEDRKAQMASGLDKTFSLDDDGENVTKLLS